MSNCDPGDRAKGFYEKFNVERVDGGSKHFERHEHCDYFVIDLDHDPNACAALMTYAAACDMTHPLLADDLRQIALSTQLEGPTGPHDGIPAMSDSAREALLQIAEMRAAADALGSWLASALVDPKVCDEMKRDVRAWFDSLPATWSK